MPSSFPSTAEHVVAAVEAVFLNGRPTSPDFVADFADIELSKAESALELSAELGLLSKSSADFQCESPLCRYFMGGRQGVAVPAIRLALEAYDPFRFFRARLADTPDGSTAARHTQTKFGLPGHRDGIRDTLVSLGTYSHALDVIGGGQYGPPSVPAANALADLANVAGENADAEARIRAQLGAAADGAPQVDVIDALTDALTRAGQGDGAGAVQQAGNAVEAYLVEVAALKTVNFNGANGLNAKVERLKQHAALPEKIVNVSKYLGHIRNAADHGPDQEIGKSWQIRPNTGVEYVFVACSFVATLHEWQTAGPGTL